MAPSRVDKDITANYQLENLELATGGFGKVFRATDRKHPERRVAIKSMLLASQRHHQISENEEKLMQLASMSGLSQQGWIGSASIRLSQVASNTSTRFFLVKTRCQS